MQTMDSDIYSSSSSRCSSVCGSTASRKSAPFKPRRLVGDVVRISSCSKIHVNVNSSQSYVPTPLVVVNNEDNNCDNTKSKMVSESVVDGKDLPKIRNRIFEESLESQEISFYIGELLIYCDFFTAGYANRINLYLIQGYKIETTV